MSGSIILSKIHQIFRQAGLWLSDKQGGAEVYNNKIHEELRSSKLEGGAGVVKERM